MRYALIEGHRGMCRLPVMCRVLAVSKSGYFAWRDGRERPCVSGDRALSVRIKAIHEESRQTYGSPRIHHALKTQGAAIASHDLREPLRMITSYARLLQQRLGEKLDDKSRTFMAHMTDGAKRMDDLIKAILDYSHVGHQGIDAELIDAGAVAGCSLHNLAQKIRDTHATIDCKPLPPVVADPVLLGQLLQNLVSNAIKFTAKDRLPKVVINACESAHEWVFSVADNGIGIRAEDTERIFTLFQRVYSASEYPGTGIGLATCKKIVERHHGRLWLESTIDVGTTFFFSLPKSSSPVAALDLLLHTARDYSTDATAVFFSG